MGKFIDVHVGNDGDRNDQLSRLAHQALAAFFQKGVPYAAPDIYKNRLKHELEVITSTGSSGYFLLVAEMLDHSRMRGIPVGPGRGSVGGSLTAYLLGITEVDPIRHGLVFERFFNPMRGPLPDIDIDVSVSRRDEVIGWLRAKKGRLCTGYITVGCGRIHAAKVLVADRPLHELLPTFQYGETTVADCLYRNLPKIPGLFDLDILGLEILDKIDGSVELIRQAGHEIDIHELPLDDMATYELLARGDTDCVFQLDYEGETGALLSRLMPSRFDHLVAFTSLFRPLPLLEGLLENYINRKNAAEPFPLMHPVVNPILADTFGIIVYQEQLMLLAQEVAGFSMVEADFLRKALGRKSAREIHDNAIKFKEGATRNLGLPVEQIDEMWVRMANEGGFAFNKAHSIAYSMITYRTAYLKAHYPREFRKA